jgi:hypothetical protein
LNPLLGLVWERNEWTAAAALEWRIHEVTFLSFEEAAFRALVFDYHRSLDSLTALDEAMLRGFSIFGGRQSIQLVLVALTLQVDPVHVVTGGMLKLATFYFLEQRDRVVETVVALGKATAQFEISRALGP